MPSPSKPNIFLFHGEDQEALQNEINIWTKNFEQKFGSTNLSSFKNSSNLSQIIGEAKTLPFLSDKRLILNYNLYSSLDKTQQDKLLKILEQIPESSIFVLIETKPLRKNSKLIKNIAKIGTVKEFSKSPASLKKKALSQLTKLNKTINSSDLDQIIKDLEQNPFKIQNELEKIALFSQSSEITKADIQAVISSDSIVSVFKLMDSISAKNLKTSLRILHELNDRREDLMKLFYLIIRQIRLTLQAKYLQDQGHSSSQIAKAIKVPPFSVSRFTSAARNLSYDQLFTALQKLLDIDTAIKTGKIKYSNTDPKELLFEIEKFIIWISQL